jgi:hypothetical protein
MTVAGFFDGDLTLAFLHTDGSAWWALVAISVVLVGLAIWKWLEHEASLYKRSRHGGTLDLTGVAFGSEPFSRDVSWEEVLDTTTWHSGYRDVQDEVRQEAGARRLLQAIHDLPDDVPPAPARLGVPESRTSLRPPKGAA